MGFWEDIRRVWVIRIGVEGDNIEEKIGFSFISGLKFYCREVVFIGKIV